MGQDKNRLIAIESIIRTKKVQNQTELQQHLISKGVDTTQSSISRSLSKLGVIKLGGFYQMPGISPGKSTVIEKLDIRCAGDSLLVLKTVPGSASRVAYYIDNSKISEVVGTIAGDDTVFVSVGDKSQQAKAIKKIVSLFV